MAETFGELLRKKRLEKDLSLRDLGELSNLDFSYIGRLEKGTSIPSRKAVKKLADALNLPADHLLLLAGYIPYDSIVQRMGRARRESDSNNEKFEIDLLSLFEDDTINLTVGDTAISNKERLSLLSKLNNIESSPNIQIPILGTIRAGLPLLAEDNCIGEIEIPPGLRADFALKVEGDSMSWAGIHEGDTAILRKDIDPQHGMIVAAGVEEEVWSATLKYYIKENGQQLLRAANPDYEDIEITENHRIIGQVVYIQKEPPSLQEYKKLLLRVENVNKEWQEAIEVAAQHGMTGEKVKKMIEALSHMFKQK